MPNLKNTSALTEIKVLHPDCNSQISKILSLQIPNLIHVLDSTMSSSLSNSKLNRNSALQSTQNLVLDVSKFGWVRRSSNGQEIYFPDAKRSPNSMELKMRNPTSRIYRADNNGRPFCLYLGGTLGAFSRLFFRGQYFS